LLQEREAGVLRPPSNHGGSLGGAFESIAKDVPEGDWERVPSDLSKNPDHYLYGGHETFWWSACLLTRAIGAVPRQIPKCVFK
jgi:hypothetical protein